MSFDAGGPQHGSYAKAFILGLCLTGAALGVLGALLTQAPGNQVPSPTPTLTTTPMPLASPTPTPTRVPTIKPICLAFCLTPTPRG